ncbi:MAG: hypothetical protein DYH03_12555, partial [Nitrospira sp. NTP1]|nr:hypothetical protein [Nitrospira sp. NTP1]
MTITFPQAGSSFQSTYPATDSKELASSRTPLLSRAKYFSATLAGECETALLCASPGETQAVSQTTPAMNPMIAARRHIIPLTDLVQFHEIRPARLPDSGPG